MTTLDSTKYFNRKWELWRNARMFPKLTQRCDYTLTFTLGRDDFGFSYGTFDRRYTGPALDLTGATVKLIGEKMPQKPSLVDEARGEWWSTTQAVFEVTGTIINASSGIVTFMLDTEDTDVLGNCLAMIEVTDSDENEFVPGYVRMYFLERLG